MIPFFGNLSLCQRERRKTVLVRGKTVYKHLCGRTFFLFLFINVHVKSDFQTVFCVIEAIFCKEKVLFHLVFKEQIKDLLCLEKVTRDWITR